jgi:hypothetical protein
MHRRKVDRHRMELRHDMGAHGRCQKNALVALDVVHRGLEAV